MKFLFAFLFIAQTAIAQSVSLPEPVTNNAVVTLKKNGQTSFYSFYGLDKTKKWSGVHNKIMRIDLANGKHTMVGTLPDTGRLAAGASAIGNKAYIVGGYKVLPDGKEKSSNHLFIFDPGTEKITAGANLIVPIDDHVQAVWRNQLLYVISGWSDSVNVNTIQVYDPGTNVWQRATSLPDEPGAKVFGGSGLIANDTIYLLGGAMFAKNYPPSRSFYKGVIDATNPLKITWQKARDYPGEFRYRSAAWQHNDLIYFIGGSNETYNYNGISYAGKKPVEPNKTILIYHIPSGRFSTLSSADRVMDLRGVLTDETGKTYTFGGMEEGQMVSGKLRPLKIK
jgi:N-acetylneuraminic acid mutarotase